MIRNYALAAAVAAAAIAVAGCGSGTPGAVTGTPKTSAPAATPSAAAAPAPAPSPNGTYTGSCDYTLGNASTDGSYGNNYLIGEIDLKNIGNIGTIIHVRITWPQEGYAPIAAHRTVRLRSGASKAVRFHVSAGNVANSNVIEQLQAWQQGHGYRDGCTYHAHISGTFGIAH